jgi:hypothetical protein
MAGPSPLSSHSIVTDWPAVSVAPALGLLKLIPALTNGASAMRAARGRINRAMTKCGEADNERLFTRGFDGRYGGREGVNGRPI